MFSLPRERARARVRSFALITESPGFGFWTDVARYEIQVNRLI